MKGGYWKSPINRGFDGTSSINGIFSIAMFNYWTVPSFLGEGWWFFFDLWWFGEQITNKNMWIQPATIGDCILMMAVGDNSPSRGKKIPKCSSKASKSLANPSKCRWVGLNLSLKSRIPHRTCGGCSGGGGGGGSAGCGGQLRRGQRFMGTWDVMETLLKLEIIQIVNLSIINQPVWESTI